MERNQPLSNDCNNLWAVFFYEVMMFFETENWLTLLSLKEYPLGHPVRNALVESRGLHTRNLAEILLNKKNPDDINLIDLLPDLGKVPGVETEKQKEFQVAYGSSQQLESPCWTFNKYLAHPTKFRSDTFNYGPTMAKIKQPIMELLKIIYLKTDNPMLKKYLFINE